MANNNEQFQINNQNIEHVNEFNYQESIISNIEGSAADVTKWLTKANSGPGMLKKSRNLRVSQGVPYTKFPTQT